MKILGSVVLLMARCCSGVFLLMSLVPAFLQAMSVGVVVVVGAL
jgi:hypothetical protein